MSTLLVNKALTLFLNMSSSQKQSCLKNPISLRQKVPCLGLKPLKSKERRLALADWVHDRDHEMLTPCSNCHRTGCQCLVNTSSSCCSECLAQNSKCNLVVSPKAFEEVQKLENELHVQLKAVKLQETEN